MKSQPISPTCRLHPRPLSMVALGFTALAFSATAVADCRDQLTELDQSYSSAGYMLNDSDATNTSGYLNQSRSIRDTALIMLSNGREDECLKLVEEAQNLANKASMPSIFAANELIGKEVLVRNGDSVGEIEDVMVDLDRGVVAYALVSFGGFLGFGKDLIPVPFSKFSQASDSDSLELSFDVSKLENAPRFIDGEWDLMSRRSWATEVYNYYGADPYWNDRRADLTAPGAANANQNGNQEVADTDDNSASGQESQQDPAQDESQADNQADTGSGNNITFEQKSQQDASQDTQQKTNQESQQDANQTDNQSNTGSNDNNTSQQKSQEDTTQGAGQATNQESQQDASQASNQATTDSNDNNASQQQPQEGEDASQNTNQASQQDASQTDNQANAGSNDNNTAQQKVQEGTAQNTGQVTNQESQQNASQASNQAATDDSSDNNTSQQQPQEGEDTSQNTNQASQQDTNQSGNQASSGSESNNNGAEQAETGQPGSVRSFDDFFPDLDKDSSGSVSKDEARREFAVFKGFLDMDKDGNGELSKTEFAVLQDTNQVSVDGQALIPKPEDAAPEEKWTGGKVKEESAKE